MQDEWWGGGWGDDGELNFLRRFFDTHLIRPQKIYLLQAWFVIIKNSRKKFWICSLYFASKRLCMVIKKCKVQSTRQCNLKSFKCTGNQATFDLKSLKKVGTTLSTLGWIVLPFSDCCDHDGPDSCVCMTRGRRLASESVQAILIEGPRVIGSKWVRTLCQLRGGLSPPLLPPPEDLRGYGGGGVRNKGGFYPLTLRRGGWGDVVDCGTLWRVRKGGQGA